MYLDYDEYVALGGSGEFSPFLRLSHRAEAIINHYTQNRVQRMKAVPCAVKHCMVELITSMYAADPATSAVSGALVGFSNDGYSESYAKPEVSTDAVYFGVVRDYLASERDDTGTPLLYRGVDA